MKKILKISVFLCLCFSVLTCSLSSCKDDAGIKMVDPVMSETILVNLECDDPIKTYRYDDFSFPVPFSVYSAIQDRRYVYSVSCDTAEISPSGKIDGAISNYEHVTINFESSEAPETDVTENIVVHTIKIFVTGYEDTLSSRTFEVFVINSKNGVFVSYINSEIAIEQYYEWLCENNVITKKAYDEFIRKKNTAIEVPGF
ncbi:MAG: hypothetical protein J5563_05065 [Clostridia bacterium]|nr:hypothetical protein [Clostridia bacterium]